MKNLTYFLIVLSSFAQLACSQNPKTQTEWLNKNTIELQPNETYDFTKLKDILRDKRIVALGESTHGLGEFYKIKSTLVLYLHKELGYEVLAMESGLGDINLAYEDIDTISAKNLRDYTLFGNFKAKEVDTLFNYIKSTSSSKNPLIYTGYDTQFSSDYLITKLVKLTAPIDKTLSDSLTNRMYSFQKSFGAARNNDSIGYIKHRDVFIKNAKDISQLLQKNKDSLLNSKTLSLKEYLIIQKTLEMFVRSTNLSYEDRFQGYELRDKLMAENLVWLLNDIYPNKKVIVWAHNGHIQKTESRMGNYLSDSLKNDYVSIGFAFHKGTYTARGENGLSTYPAQDSYLGTYEYVFNAINEPIFLLDLRQINEESDENGKWLLNNLDFRIVGSRNEKNEFRESNLTKDYDLIIFINESTNSKLLD